jgi:5-methylcytosine-specific restriction protein B
MLQANPKYYDLARALRDGIKTVQWSLKIHYKVIKKGAEIFLWISGPEGGLAALAEAAEDPKPSAAKPDGGADPYWTDAGAQRDGQAPYLVDLTIRHVPASIVGRDVLKAHPFLSGLEILRFANATSFTVRPDEADELRALLNGETLEQRQERYFRDFKQIAPEWFKKHDIAFRFHRFFLEFMKKNNLERAEWADFQKLGDNIHAFNTMALARAKALGNPNHPIEHYRHAFLSLLYDGATPIKERIRRFLDDDAYSLRNFGKAALEIVGQVFPDQFFIMNNRSRDALALLGLPNPRERGDKLVDEFFKVNRLFDGLLANYLKVNGRLTDLPERLEFDQFLSNLTDRFKRASTEEEDEVVEVEPEAPGKRYWVYAPGAGASEFDRFWNDGVMAIGWDKLGDLNQYPGKREILARLNAEYPGEGSRTGGAFICHAFRSLVKPGDIVFVKKGTRRLLGYGIVTGDYEYQADRGDMPHLRKVDWKDRGDWPVEAPFALKSLTNVTDYPEFVENLFQIMGVDTAGPGPDVVPVAPVSDDSPYSVDDILEESFESDEVIRGALDLLGKRKNIVLQGPPGTGKTHLARQLAWAFTGSRSGAQVELVQFHQAYSYEDFVQGFRPDEDSRLVLRQGLFLRFCSEARLEPRKPFVLVIDEINRGNISRVFGELLLALEPDKRHEGWKVRLAYDASPTGKFFVPENLHVIATMNTADRSLAMVDFALRRRFAFITLEPLFSTRDFREHLQARKVKGEVLDKVASRLSSLNELISSDVRSLGPGYQVGHSYFSQPPEDRESDEAWYQEVVKTQIAPLLREYWFEDQGKAEEQIRRLLA